MKLSELCSIGLLLAASSAANAEIRTYDLPSGNTNEVANALNAVLHSHCATLNVQCEARMLPTGQVLIEAPAATHEQIAEVLKAIAGRGAGPTPRVTLRYWVVSGVRGKPDASAADLKQLGPVLAQLERVHGELGFAIEDSLTLSTESGSNAEMEGGQLTVNEQIRSAGRTLNANIDLRFAKPPVAQDLRVAVTIESGQFLVLGERAYRGSDDSGTPLGTLFYIVHWPKEE
jgi:hypothetical protein